MRTRKEGRRWSARAIVAVTAVGTLAVAFVAINLTPGEKQIEQKVPRLYSTGDPQFRRALGVLLRPQILEGNRLTTLRDGDEILPAMLAAIRSARQTITFETYIYWSGDIGHAVPDALIERAHAGVKVHVLLDWLGSSKMDAALLQETRSCWSTPRRCWGDGFRAHLTPAIDNNKPAVAQARMTGITPTRSRNSAMTATTASPAAMGSMP